MSNLDNPKGRLSPEEIADLEVLVQYSLPEDTRLALENNFPPEQLQNWDQVQEGLRTGWLNLHELRSKSSGELRSARLMVVYPARMRNEVSFILVAWVVTPDSTPKAAVEGESVASADTAVNAEGAGDAAATSVCQGQSQGQGKGKGYGSYLRTLSYDITKSHNPHAIGLVAERESPVNATSATDQTVKRASWMKRIGLLRIDELTYEIPPLMTAEEREDSYVPVSGRRKAFKAADLLLSRFDGQRIVDGKIVYSIVERIYESGYSIKSDDPYLVERLSQIEQNKTYNLVEN
jgi:hypothetical protein